MAFEVPAFAEDLTLVGDGDVVWDPNSTIWTNTAAGGAPVKFNRGDNILISSDYFTGESLRMDGTFYPGAVVFDIANTMKFGWGNKRGWGLGLGTGMFTKRGEGTLILSANLAGAVDKNGKPAPMTGGANQLTNGVEIAAGEIACLEWNAQQFLGLTTVPFWVNIRNGASLSFLSRNQTGSFGNDACGIKIQLDKGATLNICTNFVDWSITETRAPLSVNTLKLNGGTINVGAGWHTTSSNPNKMAPGYLGGNSSMYVYNTIHFAGEPGDEKRSLGCGNDFADGNHLISLRSRNPVEIRVDDFVDGVDAEMCMKGFTWGTNANEEVHCELVKTGAGTLCFPSNVFNSVYDGSGASLGRYFDLFIQEGTVEFLSLSEIPGQLQTFFQANATDPLQTITISTNGNMILRKRNIANVSVTGIPNIKIVVDHGTLTYDTETVPENDGAIPIKDWVFDDATLDIRAAGMDYRFGIFMFKNSATFRGTRPLDMMPCFGLPASTSAKMKRRDDNQAVSVWIEDGKRTTFDVADMTGDGRTDVTMGYRILDGYTANTAEGVLSESGFVKIGLGTFSVASSTNSVSGVITVSNGTMRVDGELVTPRSVEVAAGAFIGGTGTVARVAMEAGSGFNAPAGQDKPLTVEGNLALPATGIVNISNLGGYEGDELPAAKLVTATGTLSGAENLQNWTVTIDGVPTSTWRVHLAAGNVVRATKNRGLRIIFK